MFVGVCVIRDGVHAFRGPDCPHERTEDELGPIQPTGWTAQQAIITEEHNHE